MNTHSGDLGVLTLLLVSDSSSTELHSIKQTSLHFSDRGADFSRTEFEQGVAEQTVSQLDLISVENVTDASRVAKRAAVKFGDHVKTGLLTLDGILFLWVGNSASSGGGRGGSTRAFVVNGGLAANGRSRSDLVAVLQGDLNLVVDIEIVHVKLVGATQTQVDSLGNQQDSIADTSGQVETQPKVPNDVLTDLLAGILVGGGGNCAVSRGGNDDTLVEFGVSGGSGDGGDSCATDGDVG